MKQKQFTDEQIVAVLQQAEKGEKPLTAANRHHRRFAPDGPDFVALALRGFLRRSGVATDCIAKGCPWQNGFAESFNGRLHDEFLNQEVFLSVLARRSGLLSYLRCCRVSRDWSERPSHVRFVLIVAAEEARGRVPRQEPATQPGQ